MNSNNVGYNYYSAMGNKNLEKLSSYLHPEVHFISPLGQMQGKENVVNGAKGFMSLFSTINIRNKFKNTENNTEVIIFDLECPNPIGNFSASTLITIKDGLIHQMELFYDTKPFQEK